MGLISLVQSAFSYFIFLAAAFFMIWRRLSAAEIGFTDEEIDDFEALEIIPALEAELLRDDPVEEVRFEP